ncbi:response regulator transcription factor (plasmid) [Leisingera sp. S132]|uniref:helix-turn-helix transcriptional regulator n=1 Tax=Leisingera sp. S132 TaxID=2867016 RepID=UPI0021A39731|nr:response regulator transcription factor [Leisingera sp. S132]UWQ81855.1 response regulator transcription factor [Leisingera sp. S132]
MFLTICEANDYETGRCCGALAELPPLSAQDMVLCYSHAAGAELQEELQAFRIRNSAVPLILITGDGCPVSAQRQLSRYAEAVIPERKSAGALIAALQVVQDGYRIVLSGPPETRSGAEPEPPAGAAAQGGDAPARPQHGLSEREQLILAKLTEGATNKSIANELGICEATVKVHLRTCFRKIGAKNRTQAALWASGQLPPQMQRH